MYIPDHPKSHGCHLRVEDEPACPRCPLPLAVARVLSARTLTGVTSALTEVVGRHQLVQELGQLGGPDVEYVDPGGK